MVRPTILAVLAAVSVAYAAEAQCGLANKCPKDSPCCSQYGACGTGAYCLGGCDPRSSFSLDSCVPGPVCQSKKYDFKNMDRITANDKYLGDASETDWVMDGQAAIYNGNVLLTMPPETVGTVLSSSTYMWYGNVKARMRTSQGAGVVTAFILMSDVKDEIDYEWVGTDLEQVQTNYYFQGITSYVNSGNISLSNTVDNFHDYEVQWTPDEIRWVVDGQTARTKKRSETWNATSSQWDFPQTPARIQLSVWPGGLATNAKGTIDWAGGVINWQSDLMKPQGYYYAEVESVEVDCFNAKSSPGTNQGKSYTYSDIRVTNDTVVDGDKNTVLKSLQGSGTDMDKGQPSKPSSGSKASETVNTVPGRNGMTNPSGNEDAADASRQSSGGSSTGSGDSNSDSNGFSQGDGGQQNGAGKMGMGDERVLKGSMFAGIVAGVAMMAL